MRSPAGVRETARRGHEPEVAELSARAREATHSALRSHLVSYPSRHSTHWTTGAVTPEGKWIDA